MFFRMDTDGMRTPVELRGLFSGPEATACWIIGGGPSLRSAPCDAIQQSPVAKFAVNLSGSGLIRPTLWTAYDPTVRFHRSIYLDASILKLVSVRRAMDLAPDSNFKVCECPNLVFFERDPQRGFHNFPRPTHPVAGKSEAVTDWQDSLIQAVDLAYWLGFRQLFLAGCEMHVRPELEHLEAAACAGVHYQSGQLLKDFYDRCRAQGLTLDQLEAGAAARPYHFDETKSLPAAIQTDWHYFRVAQYLRLSRRALGAAGLRIVSVTPGSRLNDYFPYQTAESALIELGEKVGDPERETTRGRYALDRPQAPEGRPSMRDFRPHHWAAAESRSPRSPAVNQARLRAVAEELPEIAVELNEDG